jgi:antitoxin StbD
MAIVHVLPLSVVRGRLSELVARFRTEGIGAEPIVFGSQRRPEAVLLPYETYERLRESAARREVLDEATASVRAEGLEPSGVADGIAERWVRGEITEDEMYAETVRQYRRP